MIWHLIPQADYLALGPDEPVRPASLASEGFIHCTGDLAVLRVVADKFYRSVPGAFLVLEIDPDRLTAPVKYEAPAPPPPPGDPLAQHRFPHIYGPLNRAAIVGVRPVQRAADGTFLTV